MGLLKTFTLMTKTTPSEYSKVCSVNGAIEDLYLDDEDYTLRILQSLLSQWGY
jgi:hypothetical protein